jgi:hypothetical protein
VRPAASGKNKLQILSVVVKDALGNILPSRGSSGDIPYPIANATDGTCIDAPIGKQCPTGGYISGTTNDNDSDGGTTNRSKNTYWEMDLGSIVDIKTITFTGPVDSTGVRIEVLKTNETAASPITSRTLGATLTQTITFNYINRVNDLCYDSCPSINGMTTTDQGDGSCVAAPGGITRKSVTSPISLGPPKCSILTHPVSGENIQHQSVNFSNFVVDPNNPAQLLSCDAQQGMVIIKTSGLTREGKESFLRKSDLSKYSDDPDTQYLCMNQYKASLKGCTKHIDSLQAPIYQMHGTLVNWGLSRIWGGVYPLAYYAYSTTKRIIGVPDLTEVNTSLDKIPNSVSNFKYVFPNWVRGTVTPPPYLNYKVAADPTTIGSCEIDLSACNVYLRPGSFRNTDLNKCSSFQNAFNIDQQLFKDSFYNASRFDNVGLSYYGSWDTILNDMNIVVPGGLQKDFNAAYGIRNYIDPILDIDNDSLAKPKRIPAVCTVEGGACKNFDGSPNYTATLFDSKCYTCPNPTDTFYGQGLMTPNPIQSISGYNGQSVSNRSIPRAFADDYGTAPPVQTMVSSFMNIFSSTIFPTNYTVTGIVRTLPISPTPTDMGICIGACDLAHPVSDDIQMLYDNTKYTLFGTTCRDNTYVSIAKPWISAIHVPGVGVPCPSDTVLSSDGTRCMSQCSLGQKDNDNTCTGSSVKRTPSMPTYTCTDSNMERVDNMCLSKCLTGEKSNGEYCDPVVTTVPPDATIKCMAVPSGTVKKWLCDTSTDTNKLLKGPDDPTTIYIGPDDILCTADDPTTGMYYCQSIADVNAKVPVDSTRTDFSSSCDTLNEALSDLSGNLSILETSQTTAQTTSGQVKAIQITLQNTYTAMCKNKTSPLCTSLSTQLSQLNNNINSGSGIVSNIANPYTIALASRDSLSAQLKLFQCNS